MKRKHFQANLVPSRMYWIDTEILIQFITKSRLNMINKRDNVVAYSLRYVRPIPQLGFERDV